MARENGRNAETGNVAAAGRELIYTSASFSGQSDFAAQKSCDCAVAHITKSACPPAAEKRLPTAICPHSRWRSQPLSSVSRKQRYNTLDFASKIVCQQGCCAPLLETQRQRGFSPLNSPYFLRRWVSKLQKCSLERLLRKCKRKSVPMSGGLPFLLTI